METGKDLIILVDDNPATLRAGKNVLSKNYDIVTAPSAAKMFSLLENNSPALILLDIDMPEMNGYEAIKILKSKPETSGIPVIFLTGKTESDDELEGLSLGAIDYITKPFQPPLLLKRIEVHLLVEAQKKSLDAARLRADEENLSKSQFLAYMSHEIRTPMNAILGMAELILQEKPAQKIMDKAGIIKNAGANLLVIINDILDFSKIEAGRLDIVPHDYSFKTFIQGVIDIIRIRANAKNLAFETLIDENIPAVLYGDDQRIREILINLLGNSVKYTEKGKITLWASCKSNAESETVLCFQVSDTGIGIKSEDMPQLFTGFTRFDTHRNAGVQGTGLGLAITHQLCTMMGGSINVESAYGKGSVFTVRVPQQYRPGGAVDCGAGGMDRATETQNAAPERANFIAPDARVLIVDDIDYNLQVAEGFLAPYRMRVDCVKNGEQALEKTSAANYDLVFMDHMMAGMDGVEAVAAIRTQEKAKDRKTHVPVIALTSNAISGMREFFIENGFDDFLPKPVEIARMDEIVSRWLPESKKRRDVLPGSDTRRETAVEDIAEEARLDMLKHYKKHFEDGKDADEAYLARFAELVSAFKTHAKKRRGSDIAAADALVAAAKAGDTAAISAVLPGFYNELTAAFAAGKNAAASGVDAAFTARAQALGEALQQGDKAASRSIMKEIAAMPLTEAAQELYVDLYDLFMMDEFEQAQRRLALWLNK
ncbi:hypothetical protein AGMMS49928_10600 [Spirochaetia bacterium]|nr:hypothetical protein AGMMS49928_10600 [Spirochaetia bacterium]